MRRADSIRFRPESPSGFRTIVRTNERSLRRSTLARTLLCSARMKELLDWLADQLIRELRVRDPEIAEGYVRTVGPPGYRRLDYHNRALAYVRRRPKKGMVRIDVPNVWRTPIECRLSLPSANGWALAVRCEKDLADAVQAVLTAVDHARARGGPD